MKKLLICSLLAATVPAIASAQETPRPNVDVPRPNVDVPRPNVDVPRPNIDVPRPNVDVPRPSTDSMRTGPERGAPTSSRPRGN